MERQYTENWKKIYDSVNKPLTDLTELNINTITNWTKNKGYFDELAQAKKPEDFIATQVKLANIGQLEAIAYAKKAGDIWKNAIEEWNELYTEVVRDTAVKTTEVIRTGQKSKDKE